MSPSSERQTSSTMLMGLEGFVCLWGTTCSDANPWDTSRQNTPLVAANLSFLTKSGASR